MNIFMTGIAERDPITWIISQLKMVFPFFDMMGLYCSCIAALLACVIVADIYGIAPLAILVGVAFLVGIGFSTGKSFAFSTAIFC
jgi:hypothetical protein